MKFLSYQKEGAKADAGVKKVTAVNTTTPDGKKWAEFDERLET